MDYLFHILVMICIYSILAVSLNLLVGYTGLLTVAHAAFMGVGAYVSAILGLMLGWNFLGSTAAALLTAAVISAAAALPTVKIRGDYYIIASFGLQVILYSLFLNWDSLTNGAVGLTGIPRPRLFGYTFVSYPAYLALSFGFSAAVILFSWRLSTSPFGRVLKAIREDEVAAEALGKDVTYFKVVVFMTGCTLAAMAGSLYGHFIRFIDPSSFTLEESIFILSLVIIGGAGNIMGSVVGAILLVALPELLRFLDVPSSIAGPVRQMLYGMLIVLFMRFRPQGLLGEFRMRSR
jgi:branched-chain amino acid transport system permease protein